MKIQDLIRSAVRHLARCIPFAFHRTPAPPPPEQLALDLDECTAPGLSLRDALPVRSAEYWLKLGEPALALRELQTLAATARQHPWPLRVELMAASQVSH